MRRLVSAAALGGLLALTLPVPAAYACSVPMPTIDVDRDRVAAGGSVRVSGEETTDDEGKTFTCTTPTAPVVTPTATTSPTQSEPPSPTATAGPLPTGLPTVLPTGLTTATPAAAQAVAATPSPTTASIGDDGPPPSGPVTIAISEAYEWPEPEPPARTLATVAPNELDFQDWNIWRHSFAATVTIPAGLAPGEYELRAYEADRLFYGTARITVLPRLPDTGPATTSLAGVAVLAIVAGAVAVELGRRTAR